ncbi:hypothetical protein L1987_80719 [Smallanthus sonchifolius]|uniref:Uncharacterized protein n=1 Tax=Smallanthus sonchifolius TaxID=185202 RepID=A0ACB8YMR6_9ASTR|nr:hypothetical protein L1987_80719 [Smallanthus sonchifolius]
MDVVAADVIKVVAQSAVLVDLNVAPLKACYDDSSSSQVPEVKAGPNRCSTCRKRVGLTGFNCKLGNLLCSAHRYSDKRVSFCLRVVRPLPRLRYEECDSSVKSG